MFRRLRFRDLLRCQRVCKHWAFYLPGDDPKLKEKLFAATKRVVASKPARTMTIFLRPVWQAYTVPVLDNLPRLLFNMVFNKNMAYNTAPKSAKFHPMLPRFYHYLDLVNNDFSIPSDWDEHQRKDHTPWLSFSDLDDLQSRVDEYNYQDGSWKDQLMCVPAVDRVAVHMRWWKGADVGEADVVRKVFTKKVDTGVTMGEFVRTVRTLMAEWAVKDLKKFSVHLDAGDCEECLWDYRERSSDEDEEGVESGDSDVEQTARIRFRGF